MKKITIIFLILLFLGSFTTYADDKRNDQFHRDGVKLYDGWAYYHGHSEYPPYHGKRLHVPNYPYEGHWYRWNDWERYRNRNPYVYQHGHYEQHGNFLFFLFDDGFYRMAFSIGR